jgi:hypothetical protein
MWDKCHVGAHRLKCPFRRRLAKAMKKQAESMIPIHADEASNHFVDIGADPRGLGSCAADINGEVKRTQNGRFSDEGASGLGNGSFVNTTRELQPFGSGLLVAGRKE